MNHAEVLSRHERIALSFSGGKDSLACIYMLRPWLDRITIYHSDSGDLLPEVREIVEHVRGFAPRFVHLQQDVDGWIEQNGIPSDLVPYTAHEFAGIVGQKSRLVSRYECCTRNLMLPVWERIAADGNTLCIRGTKRGDFPHLPVVNGEVRQGVEFYYPLQDWTHEQVFDYLRGEGAPICRVYENGLQAPECAACPAWLNVGQAAYLRKYHPDLLRKYRARMAVVMAELDAPLQALNSELKELSA